MKSDETVMENRCFLFQKDMFNFGVLIDIHKDYRCMLFI